MTLNNTQINFILAMMKTISDLPTSYESVTMEDIDNNEIFDIANELKQQLTEPNLDEFEAEDEMLSYEDVVLFLQKLKTGCEFLCFSEEHGFMNVYLTLNRQNTIIIQNESDIDIDINDLDFITPKLNEDK